MRTKDEIREELLGELKSKGVRLTARAIEYEVDARFHWGRVVAEAEEFQRKHGSVRIEFIAAPDDVFCRKCREMNGRSLTIEELKKLDNKWACRCAVVMPDDQDK